MEGSGVGLLIAGFRIQDHKEERGRQIRDISEMVGGKGQQVSREGEAKWCEELGNNCSYREYSGREI